MSTHLRIHLHLLPVYLGLRHAYARALTSLARSCLGIRWSDDATVRCGGGGCSLDLRLLRLLGLLLLERRIQLAFSLKLLLLDELLHAFPHDKSFLLLGQVLLMWL